MLIRDVLQLARARSRSRASAPWRSSCAPSSCARATARVSAGSRSTCKRHAMARFEQHSSIRPRKKEAHKTTATPTSDKASRPIRDEEDRVSKR
jgi:hypothetical protein